MYTSLCESINLSIYHFSLIENPSPYVYIYMCEFNF